MRVMWWDTERCETRKSPHFLEGIESEAIHRHKGLELVEKEHRCEVRQDEVVSVSLRGFG